MAGAETLDPFVSHGRVGSLGRCTEAGPGPPSCSIGLLVLCLPASDSQLSFPMVVSDPPVGFSRVSYESICSASRSCAVEGSVEESKERPLCPL